MGVNVMNYAIKKLLKDFESRIGQDEIKMLQNVNADAAFNYVFFLYKKIYGDYPSGELYKYLETKYRYGKAAAAA